MPLLDSVKSQQGKDEVWERTRWLAGIHVRHMEVILGTPPYGGQGGSGLMQHSTIHHVDQLRVLLLFKTSIFQR